LRQTLSFLREFTKRPTKIGAVAPSSRDLVGAMMDSFDWDRVRTVVEFGPGTGVFTRAVMQRMHGEARFMAIEQSERLASIARQNCPGAVIRCDTVTNLHRLCDADSIDTIDAVVCGLPWAAFSDSLQREILDVMTARMSPGGTFATFAYLQGVYLPAGRRFSRRLDDYFSTIRRSPTVWRNLPPAFVYRCGV